MARLLGFWPFGVLDGDAALFATFKGLGPGRKCVAQDGLAGDPLFGFVRSESDFHTVTLWIPTARMGCERPVFYLGYASGRERLSKADEIFRCLPGSPLIEAYSAKERACGETQHDHIP
jgi:hypothetical protein